VCFLGRFRSGPLGLISNVPTFAEIPLTEEEIRDAKRAAGKSRISSKQRASLLRERHLKAVETLLGLPPRQQSEIKRAFAAARRSKPTLLFQDWLLKH
jgi:hypothetical protein